jgi:hypothetical protein
LPKSKETNSSIQADGTVKPTLKVHRRITNYETNPILNVIRVLDIPTMQRTPDNITMSLSAEIIRKVQDADEIVKTVHAWLSQKIRPKWEEIASQSFEIQHFWSQLEMLTQRNDIFYRLCLWPDGSIRYYQLIVPRNLRRDVQQSVHNSPTAGHMGVNKTIDSLIQYGYWRGWRKDVELYVSRCNLCNRYRHTSRYKQGPLQELPVCSVGQRIHVDLMGLFVRSRRYKYLLSAICPFSKYLVCVPIADKTALNVAKALVKHVL